MVDSRGSTPQNNHESAVFAEPSQDAQATQKAVASVETTSDTGQTALDRVLSLVDDSVEHNQPDIVEQQTSSISAHHSLCVGFVRSRTERNAQVTLLDGHNEQAALVSEHVQLALVDQAIADRALVLISRSGAQLQIIGLVQTRLADQTIISGQRIVVEAGEELTLRSGRAAIQLRSDGSIEMLGSRIAATSRGVFRLIGRALRLN